MTRALAHLTLSTLLFIAAACSGNVGRYNDTRSEDSIAEAQAEKQAPITKIYKGEEGKRRGDSILNWLMTLGNIDSTTLFNTPEGYARVFDSGTTYLRKLTPEEMEENAKRFGTNDPRQASGDIIAYTLDGQEVGKAGYKERGKPYVINTTGLPAGTYMLSIPGEKQMKKIVVQ
jgi:hypothetical protein